MTSFDELIAGLELREDVVTLCMRGDLAAKHERLNKKLPTASTVAESLGEPSEAQTIARQMQEVRDEMVASERDFSLRALPSDEWSDLFIEQPSAPEKGPDGKVSPEDRTKFRSDFTVWWWKAVAATCYDPVMAPNQVAQLAKKLSHPQWRELTDRVWAINTGEEQIPFSESASALLQDTEPS